MGTSLTPSDKRLCWPLATDPTTRAIASKFGRHNSPRRAPTRGAPTNCQSFSDKKPASSRQRPLEFATAHYDLHSSRRFAMRRAPTRGAPTRFRQLQWTIAFPGVVGYNACPHGACPCGNRAIRSTRRTIDFPRPHLQGRIEHRFCQTPEEGNYAPLISARKWRSSRASNI